MAVTFGSACRRKSPAVMRASPAACRRGRQASAFLPDPLQLRFFATDCQASLVSSRTTMKLITIGRSVRPGSKLPPDFQPPPPLFPSEQNNPFRLEFLPEQLADHNPLHYLNKSGSPKAEMVDSIRLLCELVKQSPLSRKALYKRAGVSSSSAITYCANLAKLGMIRVEDVQRNFLTRLHYITVVGKIHLLSVTELDLDQFGVNRQLLFREVIFKVATPQDGPYLTFVKKFLVGLLANNNRDVLQKWVNETARELFWKETDEEDSQPQPESALSYSWYWMIPSLTMDELESYLRTLNDVRPNLSSEEAQHCWYRLRALSYRNPDLFEALMTKLNLPELAAWISH